MKKKTFGILVACMAAVLLLGVVGISLRRGQNPVGKEHTHTLTEVKAKAATCTENGTIRHWQCSDCEKLFTDEKGKNKTNDVLDYALGHDVLGYPGTMPTTEAAGTKAHFVCQKCGGIFLDKVCSKQTTEEGLIVPQVQENIDGNLTGSFYPAKNALYLGGEDLKDGGVGVTVNARTGERGVYLHMKLNHLYDYLTQEEATIPFLRTYITARNKGTNEYAGRGVKDTDQDVMLEFSLNGMMGGDSMYYAEYYKTYKNPEGSKTPYSTVWELFIPYADLAAANGGALEDAFETNNGVCTVKSDYRMYFTIVGSMFANADGKAEIFESTATAGCDIKDDGYWYFWFVRDYGDWSRDQKMLQLTNEGLIRGGVWIGPNGEYILDGGGDADGTNHFVEARLGLPASVANSKYVMAETTVKYGSKGEVGLWSHRFGIKMTEKNGMAVTMLPADGDDPRLQTYPLYGEKEDDIFAGWSDMNKQYYGAVKSALEGNGLRLRILRSDTKIILYAYVNGAWVQFGYPATCDTNAQTDIRFVICDGTWKFSNYGYEALEYVPVKRPTLNATGMFAHLRSQNGKLYTLDGVETTTEALTIPAGVLLDGEGKATSTSYYVDERLNLPASIANSKYVALETTLKFNGEVGLWSHRFGIMMVDKKGLGTTVLPAGDADPRLQIFALYGEGANDIFAGWSNEYTKYYNAVASALNGDGLKLRVVRSDTQIIQYAYLNGTWVQLGYAVECDSNAKTDIRFVACDGSWTFSKIKYDALTYVPVVEPQIDKTGVYAHLKDKNGKLYTLTGVPTSKAKLTIPKGLLLDGAGGAEATGQHDNYYVEKALDLSEEVKNSAYAVAEATVKFAGGSDKTPWWRRFGIKMTADDGVGVMYFDAIKAFELYGNPSVIFADAVGNDYTQYKGAVDAALNGNGLKLRVVRSGAQIIQYAYLNGAWRQFGPVVPCDSDAKTDIRFLACDGLWSFSNIKNSKLTYVPKVPATVDASGRKAYLKDEASGKLYTIDGAETTEQGLIIPAVGIKNGLQLTVTGKKDGNVTALSDGTEVKLVHKDIDYTKQATITDGKITVDLAYGEYDVTAGEDYVGSLSVVKESLPTKLKMEYKYATSTGMTYGNVDLSKMNDVNHTLTLDGFGNARNESYYLEAGLNLPEAVKNAKYVIAETTVKFNGGAGGDSHWWYRFGIKMTENNGTGVYYDDDMGWGNGFSLYGNGSDPFVNSNNLSFDSYFATVQEAIKGEGLKLRVVRSGEKIAQYAYLNGEWKPFSPQVTCNADDKTDIRFLVCDGSWTFSDIKFRKLDYVAATAPTFDEEGMLEHLKDENGNLYTLNGFKTTSEMLRIPALKDVTRNLQLTVTGKKDGSETVLSDGTTITLAHQAYTYTQDATISNGKLTVELPDGEYKVTADGYDDYEGILLVSGESQPDKLTLEYQYATSTGMTYGEIDFSKMNEANHALTLDGQGGANGDGGDAKYLEAKLTLLDSVANSKNVAVETTVKFNGGADDDIWWRRFGIKMTADKGVGVYRDGWMMTFELNDTPGYVFRDSKQQPYPDYWEAAQNAVNGEGLQLRVVRSGNQIAQYAYLNGEWKPFGPLVTCGENDATDIRFLICDGSWTFRDTSITELSFGATSTGMDYGNVDFSKINDENHAVTLDGCGVAENQGKYLEAKLTLPDTVANSKNVTVETTLKFNDKGYSDPWWFRSGIKMTADDGLGVLHMNSTNARPFELYGESLIFADGVGIDYPEEYVNAVTAQLDGEGLKLRVVRSGNQITQYAYLNGEWKPFGPTVTCDANAKTDIRFLVCDGSWTFSNTTWTVGETVAPISSTLTHEGVYNSACDHSMISSENNELWLMAWDPTTPGMKDYKEAKLNLPESAANWKNVAVETTLKFNNDTQGEWWERFGIKMTEDKGVATLVNWDALQVFGLYMNSAEAPLDGVSSNYEAYLAKVKAAIAPSGEGLKLRVVRMDTQIIQYAYLDGAWVQLGDPVTCGANAATDIRFLIYAGNWTFKNTNIYKLP